MIIISCITSKTFSYVLLLPSLTFCCFSLSLFSLFLLFFLVISDSPHPPLLLSPHCAPSLSSSPPFALVTPFSHSPSLCVFNLCGCLMKSLLKWTIVALRIFIERNNQPGCVCLHASPATPLFKEIISWRQDCESSELWAKQQADRIGSTEPWVNKPGIMGTAAANVYFIMTNMVTAQLMQLKTVQHRGWQILKMCVIHRKV